MLKIKDNPDASETPLCSLYGECGGCVYQHLTHSAELAEKENWVKGLFQELNVDPDAFEPITASPSSYYYRNRIDLSLRRFKSGNIEMGFYRENTKRFLEVGSCVIARKEIAQFIPELKKQAIAKFPADYRVANLVVRTGDDGRVFWGGIGRRSLQMAENDYLWAEVRGKKIFYSLDTFFQANTAILNSLFEKLENWISSSQNNVFFDLYSGVGLFGIVLSDFFKKIFFIEESDSSVKLLQYNLKHHQLSNVEFFQQRVESILPMLLANDHGLQKTGMVDPPRKGLSQESALFLSQQREFQDFFYLSCNPESLVRDLKIFFNAGWRLIKVAPFDFFPRTKHLETLVWMKPQ